MSKSSKQVPLASYVEYAPEEMANRAAGYFEEMRRRRTVRDFSDRPIAPEVIESCLRTAGTAPSGANQQPWHFAVIQDAGIKAKIRSAAEEEEKAFYGGRAPDDWLQALGKIGTGWEKPFLETAPCLIAIFQQNSSVGEDGSKVKHYYPKESVGLAVGMLIAALHHAGLASLTHTPSPMGFLNEILERPESEKPFLLLVVGYPAADAMVPDIERKPLRKIASFY